MPGTPSKNVSHARGVVAGLSRSRSQDDGAYVAARQTLKAALLKEHVEKTLRSFPPLTPDQIDVLAGLLQSTRNQETGL